MENKNICLCWNDKKGDYLKYVLTTLISILDNNLNVNLFLITKSINKKQKEILVNLLNKYPNSSYSLFEIKKYTKINSFLTKLNSFNLSSYDESIFYRLALPLLLPKKISNVLYLDCDIIVKSNLSDLFEININDYMLGGVLDQNFKSYSRAGKFNLKYYINTGVLFMNLSKLRQIKSYESYLLNTLSKIRNKLIFPDQDLINYLFYGDILLINKKYNYMLNPYNKLFYNKKVKIIHYTYLKPWINPCYINLNYLKLYYSFLDKSYWANWRPEFNFKKGFVKTNNLALFLIYFFRKLKIDNFIKRIISYN